MSPWVPIERQLKYNLCEVLLAPGVVRSCLNSMLKFGFHLQKMLPKVSLRNVPKSQVIMVQVMNSSNSKECILPWKGSSH